MATRRSRIKAVANLPARRNRPLPLNEIKKEDSEPELNSGESSQADKVNLRESSPKTARLSESVELSAKSKSSKSNVQESAEEISQSADVLQSLPDRKSVIVTVDKDRKSVIVNRDRTKIEPASEKPPTSDVALGKKSSGTEVTPTKPSDSEVLSQKSLDNEVTCDKSQGKEVASVKPLDSEAASEKPQDNEVASAVPNSDANTSQNKCAPLRGRRSKPAVNLSAATRKRSGTDNSSPCSPPPNKIRGLEPLQNKSAESESTSEPGSSLISNECHQVEPCEVKEQSQTASCGSASLPQPPTSPPPVSGQCAPSSKIAHTASGQFKVPVSPASKTKDPLPGPSNDSCLNVNSPAPSSPQKETSAVRRKQSTSAQRVAAARKSLKSRFSTEGPPPRSALTMFDLIFYNPSKNPMKSSDSLASKPRRRLTSVSSVLSVSSIHEDRLNEESVDDVEEDKSKEDSTEAMPVPRVKVGPDGSLILDEQSLVIETTGTKKSREDLEKSEVVVDTGSSYGHYKKIMRSKDWSDHETKKFYRALNVVGTDFSLMKPYFRNRTRRELKLKFKKEERLNPNLVNKALGEPLDFDITELEKECAIEDEEEKRQEEIAKEKASEHPKEKVLKDGENKVKQPTKKKQPKTSLLYAEMELEVESSPGLPQHTSGVIKKPRKVTDAETDYNTLAQGVKSDINRSCKKTRGRKVLTKTADTNQEPKKIEVDSTNKPKPPKRTRKKPPTSSAASESLRKPSESGGESDIPMTQNTPPIPQSQASQRPDSIIPLSSGFGSSGTRLLPATPLSRIRTVQASPQITPPIPGFGMSTPVNRLLPSTPSLPRMEPGSIIVLKTPLPQNPDRHILQVYMVTNTPSGSSTAPLSPIVPGISLIPATSVQSSPSKSCISDDSDSEKVLTKL